MDQREQIIIVNWKWSDFEEGVNADILKEKKYHEHLGQIEKGRGKYFQEYPVEYSEMCPLGKFVTTGIYKDDEHTENLLFAVLEQYIKGESDVLLFLHRGHFYKEADVLAIQKRFEKHSLKCFLIADGRDYIYYPTQKSGILNDKGGFFIGVDEDTEEYIKTFDRVQGIVKQPYFDRVWAHYRFEFQSQVFELKEEIFAVWFELLLPYKPEQIEVASLKEHLAQRPGRALLYRIHSFAGRYKTAYIGGISLDPEVIRLNNEAREIEKLEKTERKSFLFDDAIANIDFQDPLEIEFYQETSSSLSAILLDPEKTTTTKTALRDLAEKFNLLVKATPGEFSN